MPNLVRTNFVILPKLSSNKSNAQILHLSLDTLWIFDFLQIFKHDQSPFEFEDHEKI